MVQTMDTELYSSIDKLKDISNKLRANGLIGSAMRVDKALKDIHDTVSPFLQAMESQGLIVEEGIATPASGATSVALSTVAADTATQGSVYSTRTSPRLAATPQSNSLVSFDQNTARYVEIPELLLEDTVSVPSTATPTDNTTSLLNSRLVNGISARRHVGIPEPSILEDDFDEEAGEVILYGNFTMPNPLSFVTTQIREGPLFEIMISPAERHATITFQRKTHASRFLGRNEEMRLRTGSSLYGKAYTLAPGLVIPWDEQMRRMNSPTRERRRLTFARAGLFNSKLSPDNFKADIARLVGDDNIEVSWVFNAGNATVVFRSTAIARMVYQRFRSEATGLKQYAAIDVTYSTDPCEKPMVYNTQLHNWKVVQTPQLLMPPQQRRVRRQRRARRPDNSRRG